jgi:hypothetical protein
MIIIGVKNQQILISDGGSMVVVSIRYVLVFLLLYFSSGSLYIISLLYMYIYDPPDHQMNTSVIHNMILSQNIGFFSPGCTA